MQIRKVFGLNGPNIWANSPILEAWVDLGQFEDLPTDKLPGFSERLMAQLPSLIEHRCSIGERGGFLQRLETGTWLGHVLEHVTLELQSLTHVPIGWGRARSSCGARPATSTTTMWSAASRTSRSPTST